MHSSSLTSHSLLKNLEDLYFLSLEKENLTIALKIIELLGRRYDLFAPETTKKPLNLESLTEKDIKHLIKQLETKLKLDRQNSPE